MESIYGDEFIHCVHPPSDSATGLSSVVFNLNRRDEALGAVTKMHSLPRDLHFEHGRCRSHLILESAHA
jgi:hypothetical protein